MKCIESVVVERLSSPKLSSQTIFNIHMGKVIYKNTVHYNYGILHLSGNTAFVYILNAEYSDI